VRSGGKDLALEMEHRGYAWLIDSGLKEEMVVER